LGNFKLTGLNEVDRLVKKAETALKKMLGAKIVNLNCLSGLHAMMCAILSTTKPKDLILTINKKYGGHFATKSLIKLIGRKHGYIPYNLDKMEFDCSGLKKISRTNKITAIYLDASYYLKPHNLKGIRSALGNNTKIIYDASHTLGLITGGQFQNPLKEGADIICGNTHKTLPGSQKGIIAFKNAPLGKQANKIIDGSLHSSVHTHHLISLAITILEMEKFGSAYAKQIISNAQALGKAFVNLGYKVREICPWVYTKNHQIHVFLNKGVNKDHLFERLIKNDISLNFDKLLGNKFFMRIGTQEVTRLGMVEKDMTTISQIIDASLKDVDVKLAVKKLLRNHKKIKYSFD
jgi:glycine/serine hydroxymethyltransferase